MPIPMHTAKPKYPTEENGPFCLTDEEIKRLASKIEEAVRGEFEPTVFEQLERGPGDALMLAAHQLLGWDKLQRFLR